MAPPPPNRRIPIWIAGTSRPAFERAARLGDGFHGQPTRRERHGKQTAISAVPAIVREMRATRPDASSFVISLYTHEWDPAEFDADTIRRERDFLEASGVQHVVAAFGRSDAASWMRSIDGLWRILER
jgi:alkanesulfonate monooxygenase SsuD/methylene tetrahydromethanopterin reductase-like flavin-dependent oxidoreductase (luciferase family)